MTTLLALSIGLGFVHPWGDLHAQRSGELLPLPAAPAEVRRILESKCADCHSNRTHWPIYSKLAPVSWLLEHDVRAARDALNLSSWEEMRSEERIAALTRIAAEVRSGEMPPRAYTFMHPSNRLTGPEQQAIASWARAERKRIKSTNEPHERKLNP